jgi:hypothetical protein
MVIWIIGIYIVGALIGFGITAWGNDLTENSQLIASNSIFWFVWFIRYFPQNIKWLWNLTTWTWKEVQK